MGRARHDLRDGRAGGNRRRGGARGAAEPASRADGKGGSASNATSGRTKLIEGGLRLFADRPLQGFGPGSFAQEYRAHEHVTSNSATSASHTIPSRSRRSRGSWAWRCTWRCWWSAFAVLFRGAGRSPPQDRAGGVLRGAGAAHLHLRRLPRGPGDVGAAGIGVALACAPGGGELQRRGAVARRAGGDDKLRPCATT